MTTTTPYDVTYLVVVADGVALYPALDLDGERQVSVDVVDKRLKRARHQPELLREIAPEDSRLDRVVGNTTASQHHGNHHSNNAH